MSAISALVALHFLQMREHDKMWREECERVEAEKRQALKRIRTKGLTGFAAQEHGK